jgi:hypothetical protein
MNVVDLDELEQYDGLLQKIEHEVQKVDREMIKKTVTSSRAIILQTIALIITLVGLAVVAERRMTTIEIKTTTEIERRMEADKALFDAVRDLQISTKGLSESQIRVVTVLDGIDKRHTLEDQRRVVAAGK